MALPAKQAGADALIATFQTYLGKGAGVVSVQPSGDSKDVKLDFAALLSKLHDAQIRISPIRSQLTDNGDGDRADRSHRHAAAGRGGTNRHADLIRR